MKKSTEFTRVAIINRGEAAMRLIHAARELGNEGPARLSTVALFTDPDRRAMFVREADDAVHLGADTWIDERDGQRKSGYRDPVRLERALVASGADAAWIGWGGSADCGEVAALCERLGITFIGPDAAVIQRFSDKAAVKRLAEQADLRLVASSRVNGARRIDVQVLVDHHGTVWAIGSRDSTVQRRQQRVLDETPSPALTAAEDAHVRAAAARFARVADLRSACTVQFLFDVESRQFAFAGAQAGLSIESSVIEATTGVDLVKLQIHVARGGRLEAEPPPARGHAIKVRLSAEDPENDFAAAPGRIELIRLPTGPGLRVDRGVTEGDDIPAEFDPMIANVIAWGTTREEALGRLRRALVEGAVAINGGASNKAFLVGLLARPEIATGKFDAAWLDELAGRGEHIPREHGDVALLDAAIVAYASELALERAEFFASSARGRPQVQPEARRAVELRLRDRSFRFQVQQLSPTEYRIDGGGGPVDVRVDRQSPFERRLSYAGKRYHVFAVNRGESLLVEVEGVPHRVILDAAGMVRAPTPAMVLSIPVTRGRKVAAGERLAVLETMKMELAVTAPFAGRVREVLVTSNVQVHAGAPLVLLEPLAADNAGEASFVTFEAKAAPAPAADARSRWLRAFDDVRRLLLGFDIDGAEAKRLTAAWTELSNAISLDDPELLRAEQEILSTFADLHSLFRRVPSSDEPEGPEGPEGPEDHDRSVHEYFITYLRAVATRGEGLPASFLSKLTRALSHYGVTGIDRSPELEEALVRIYKAHGRGDSQAAVVAGTLDRWLTNLAPPTGPAGDVIHRLVNRLVAVTEGRFATVYDLAREVRFRAFDKPVFERGREAVYARMDDCLAELTADPGPSPRRAARIATLVDCPQPLVALLLNRFETGAPVLRALMLEVLTARYYRNRSLEGIACRVVAGFSVASAEYENEGRRVHIVATYASRELLSEAITALKGVFAEVPADHDIVLDLYAWGSEGLADADSNERDIRAILDKAMLSRPLSRVSVIVGGDRHTSYRNPDVRLLAGVQNFTFQHDGQVYREDKLYRGLHPMMGERVHLWRLSNFNIERLPSVEDVFLFRAVAKANPKDERLIGVAEVRDVTAVRDADGRIVSVPHLERMLLETLAAIRTVQARRAPHERLQYNRVLLHVWPPLAFSQGELDDVVRRLAPATEGLGIEQVAVRMRVIDEATSELTERVLRISSTVGQGLRVTSSDASTTPIQSLSEYQQKVSQLRRRGLVYPYEIVKLLTPASGETAGDFPPGDFAEYDLDAEGTLVPVTRPYGKNTANIVVGVIKSYTALYPQGMTRVILLGDPSKEMGSVAEPECRRIAAALDLGEKLNVPVEWFTLCAGAKISMDSGTENMDWVSIVLRRLIEFTQAGREINVVVCGINVGAQPYWNAEATMLMHTRGILVMTHDAAMVLTGKQSLDYSGSVSAEDNQGIGGYERIMGPNGQAQYSAADISEACKVLMAHYDHAYVAPGERFPRRAPTTDPFDRDVRTAPHPVTDDFSLVGDIFSDEKNPGRKKPFEIRAVMASVADRDHRPLERWRDMRDAGTAVIWDAHVGGYPVCMIGMESHPLRRIGFIPADGPEQLTSGTLYPQASKKVARSVNSASNNRPIVVLANLSGFDGSPEAMRTLQLEYGAEIGRAVTNFIGPIVFCVVSRYHGGAFVVFSKKLNENIEAVALEGTFASVIGGAPAAAVVFSREVDARTNKDSRIVALQDEIAKATGEQKRRLNAKLAELRPAVRSEKLGTVADEFDQVHSVHRALKTGSLDRIIPAHTLRPYIIEALERGIARALASK